MRLHFVVIGFFVALLVGGSGLWAWQEYRAMWVPVVGAFPPVDEQPAEAPRMDYLVPLKALVNGNQLWVARAGRAALIPVVLGETYGKFVGIRKGIQPGEMVILPPFDKLHVGLRVRGERVDGSPGAHTLPPSSQGTQDAR